MNQRTPFSIALSLALLLVACAPGMSAAQEGPTPKTISYSRIVDLSHTIATDIPLWPGDPPVEFQVVATIEKDGYFLRKFSIGEHSGTHMNAPGSFFAGSPDLTRLANAARAA